jgi:crotonobetainyl-CoA:carnitine CoA-transferase CaiB-like acyl-CoA transferase
MVSAPYAAKLLADLGAEVIKVERPATGDRARTRGPFAGGAAHPEKSGLFIYLNTNKRGVTIDIASPRGLSIVEKLISGADALIHNLTPAEMDHAGFQFERFHRVNPKLVMTTVAPYGLNGPRRLLSQRCPRPSRSAAAEGLWLPGGLPGRRPCRGGDDGRAVRRGTRRGRAAG